MLNYGTQPDMLGLLTAAQRAIWAAQELRPEVPYNFAAFLAIDHDVDAERLMVACESAATRFGTPCVRLSVDDGEPVFIVDRSLLQDDVLRCIDLRAEADPAAAARSWMNHDYRQPIDLLRDRLTNFVLLRVTDDESYFYLRTHHVVIDGYGGDNFLRHIAAVYSGAAADTGEVDFSDFAVLREADRKYQQSSRSRADAEYWKNVVRGPAEITDLAGMQRSVAPQHPLVRELACTHRFSENGHSQFDVARVVAALAVFIAKTTGRQDVSLSLPVSARTTAALKRRAGMVSNLVPLLVCVNDGETIGVLTDRVRKAMVGALRHQQFRRWPDLIADVSRLDMNVEFGPAINVLDFATRIRFRRADEQVKMRGYRIELGEIQAALTALDGVHQAAVIAREDRVGDKRLVGYVTGTVDPAAARAALAERLPAYMVPAAVVALAAMPLTPSGKLDVRALPTPEYHPTGGRYCGPATQVEESLVGIYAQVLGVDRVGVDDSFFDLGGDSLSAMRLITAVNTSMDAGLSVRDVLEAPTVRSLSQRLESDQASDQVVVPVQTLKDGTGIPLFCIHPGGGVSWVYHALG